MILVLRKGTKYYWRRSVFELEMIRQRDVTSGNVYDSAGEPRIYCPITSDILEEDVVVTVTRKRGVNWDHWRNKPAYLTEGITTINGEAKVILFSRETKAKQAVQSLNRGR